jgi:hypothetical protein
MMITLATNLVRMAIEAMIERDADEVSPITQRLRTCMLTKEVGSVRDRNH